MSQNDSTTVLQGSTTSVTIRNDTGATLACGQIVGIGKSIRTPDTHKQYWPLYHYHEGLKPDPDSQAFGVVLREVEDKGDCFCRISGLALVKLKVLNENHHFARPVKDVVEYLESCEKGPARILHKATPVPAEGSNPPPAGSADLMDATIFFPVGGEGELTFGIMTQRPSGAGGPATWMPAQIDANGKWTVLPDATPRLGIAPALD